MNTIIIITCPLCKQAINNNEFGIVGHLQGAHVNRKEITVAEKHEITNLLNPEVKQRIDAYNLLRDAPDKA